MFSTSLTWTDFLFLLEGAGVTLALTFWAMLLGTVVGISCGLLRALLPKATIPLGWFLDIFRSVPLLIQFVLLDRKSVV